MLHFDQERDCPKYTLAIKNSHQTSNTIAKYLANVEIF